MDRRCGNFGELHPFKEAIRREKEHDLPSFEGVDVTLTDAESGIDFDVPINLIDNMWTVKSKDPIGAVTKVCLSTGSVHYVKGEAGSIIRKINEAKIRGGHN